MNMKNEFKAIAVAAAVLGIFGGEAVASSSARLEEAAASIAVAAEAGDNGRAEALLAGLFAGGARSEAAEPVVLAAYAAQPAAKTAVLVQAPKARKPLRSAVKALDFSDVPEVPEASEAKEVKEGKEDKPDLAAIQAAAVAQAEQEMAADAAAAGGKKDEGKKDSALGSILAGSLGLLVVVGLITGSYFLLFPLLAMAL